MSESSVIAHLFGEAIADLPQDLFIPPNALQVVLSHFDGPLDLLLYLIRKQNIDILNIPMVQITEQYLAYIEQIEASKMDLAAEYLLMAAVLIEIKSRFLLPKVPDIEEEQDPRAELVKRLLVYEQMKKAAEKIHNLPQAGRDFMWGYLPLDPIVQTKLPDINGIDLQQAWLSLLNRAKQFTHHQIQQESFSVREQMNTVLSQLQRKNQINFIELFDLNRGIALLVVTFIAILELIKEGYIDVQQQGDFAKITVELVK